MIKTFARFNDLPKEVRLIVWELALEGRVVNIMQKPRKTTVMDWERANSATRREDILEAAGLVSGDYWFERDMHIMYGGEEYEGKPTTLDHSLPTQNLAGVVSNSIPPLLLACREAFDIATQHYERIFTCFGAFPQTYFNFQLDTLYIRYDTFDIHRKQDMDGILESVNGLFGIQDVENFRKVEKLAVLLDPITANDPINFYRWWDEFQICFAGIKDLYLVVQHFVQVSCNFSEHRRVQQLIS